MRKSKWHILVDNAWVPVSEEVYNTSKKPKRIIDTPETTTPPTGDNWQSKPIALKLYAFQPKGHGQASFFTIAASEAEARAAVAAHIQQEYVLNGHTAYRAEGWDTNYYTLTVVEQGGVIENDND